jgi:hypothetical protein
MGVNMSGEMWRYIIAVVLIAHGIGHVGGPWFFGRSWLSPALAGGMVRWLFIVLWLAAMLGFVGAGIGVLAQREWWRTLAIAASVLSIPVAALFLGSAATQPLINASVMDVVVLLRLLWARWPSAELIGS